MEPKTCTHALSPFTPGPSTSATSQPSTSSAREPSNSSGSDPQFCKEPPPAESNIPASGSADSEEPKGVAFHDPPTPSDRSSGQASPESERQSLSDLFLDLPEWADDMAKAFASGLTVQEVAALLQIDQAHIRRAMRHPSWPEAIKKHVSSTVEWDDVSGMVSLGAGSAIQAKIDILRDHSVDPKLRNQVSDQIIDMLQLHRPRTEELHVYHHQHTTSSLEMVQAKVLDFANQADKYLAEGNKDDESEKEP